MNQPVFTQGAYKSSRFYSVERKFLYIIFRFLQLLMAKIVFIFAPWSG